MKVKVKFESNPRTVLQPAKKARIGINAEQRPSMQPCFMRMCIMPKPTRRHAPAMSKLITKKRSTYEACQLDSDWHLEIKRLHVHQRVAAPHRRKPAGRQWLICWALMSRWLVIAAMHVPRRRVLAWRQSKAGP